MRQASKSLKELRHQLETYRTIMIGIDFDGASFVAGREFQNALAKFDFAVSDLDEMIDWAGRLAK